MICCDYNADTVVNVNDAKTVFTAAGTGDLAEYCDLSGDTQVNVADAKIVFGFAASSVYPSLVIS